jgi:UDP-3-O-[3-hydroxymyristoyl] glucosamine N-acyltransferase
MMTLNELGKALGAEVKGDGAYKIEGPRDVERLSPEQALEDGRIYFIESKAVAKRHPLASKNGAILTTAELAPEFPRALIVNGDARLTFIKMLGLFDRKPAAVPGVSREPLVHPGAKIDPTAAVMAGAIVMDGAEIGPRAVIWPGAVIETRAKIGEDTVIRSNVTIGYDCVIGKRCLIHSCTSIGADGFGFYDRPGERHKIPHIGNVVLADDVEIGASNTIDRATIESTTVGRHTKTDDQVHIGHNCRVGSWIYIVGNTALGGSVVLEDGVMISGNCIVKDHLRVGAGAIVMGASAVAQDVEPKAMLFGTPARPAKEMHRINATLAKLPELVAKVKELESKLLEKAS